MYPKLKALIKATFILLCFFPLLTKAEPSLSATKFINKKKGNSSSRTLLVIASISTAEQRELDFEKLYKQALKLEKPNTLLLEQILRYCIYNETKICEQNSIIDKLLSVDNDNFVSFVNVAIYLHNKNLRETSFQVLTDSLQTKGFNSFHWERFNNTKNVLLKTNTNLDDINQISVTTMQASPAVDPFHEIIGICEEESLKTDRWFNLCDQLGKHMELNADSIFYTFIGFALQMDVNRMKGSSQQTLTNIRLRRENFHQFRLKAVSQLPYLEFTPEHPIPQTFIKDAVNLGERVAVFKALKELNKK